MPEKPGAPAPAGATPVAAPPVRTETAVVVGAGASTGSDYTRSGLVLPMDRGFFASRVVRSMLASGRYAALPLALEAFLAARDTTPEEARLEALWAYLAGGPDLSPMLEAWREAIRVPASQTFDEHYLARQARMDAAGTATDVAANLAWLAEWDLRCLIGHVFEKLSPGENPYKLLMERLDIGRTHATVFISLNFDTVLEASLDRQWAPWHYERITATSARSPDFIRVLKPRGSINWCLREQDGKAEAFTNYHLTPVRAQSQGEGHYQTALLIPPGAAEQPPAGQPPVVRQLAADLLADGAAALAEAERVIVIGHSFSAAEGELAALFQRALELRAGAPLRELHCCTLADGHEEAVLAAATRWLPARHVVTATGGFAQFAAGY